MKLDGLEEIIKNMEAIKDQLKGDPLRSSLRKALTPIVDQAKSLAPVDTGRLRDAIKTRPLPAEDLPAGFTDGQELFVLSSRKKDPDAPDNAWYWHFVEFESKTKSGKVVPAQPFLAPAFDSKRSEAIKVFVDEMRAQLEKNVKRINRQQS